MNSHLIRFGAFSFALILLLAPAAPAKAEESSSTEASLSQLLARTSSYYGGRISSSKLRDLDDDPVEKMPIPVLMGIAVRNLTKNFGDPRGNGTREHEGLDIMAPKGAYVVSPTDAVVTSTGTGSSAGKYVYTANPGGERFAYMHLDSIEVRRGDVLKPGDLIGTVGNTGNASGGAPHLHFEIRDGREATDPYPRLTREFTAKERGEALAQIVEDADDEDEEAEKIVKAYKSTLVAAQAAGVDFPKELEEALGAVGASADSLLAGDTLYTRDLTLGSSGADVRALQSFLIAEESGEAAEALLEAGATGYFGPVTMRALAEYQKEVGISPASGYFGPLTRSRILAVI